jgi:hypothetical protein
VIETKNLEETALTAKPANPERIEYGPGIVPGA